MMLTTKSRYAVMAILEVASYAKHNPLKLAEISKSQDIPLSFLEQIFLKLKKAQLVKAIKGPGGGYSLSVPPEKISIANIVDAVEENLKMTRCSSNKSCKKDGTKCKTHDLWNGLGDQIRAYLTNLSVADILNEKIRNIDRL